MKNQKLKKMLADKLVKSSSEEIRVLTPEELHVLQGDGCGVNFCGHYGTTPPSK